MTKNVGQAEAGVGPEIIPWLAYPLPCLPLPGLLSREHLHIVAHEPSPQGWAFAGSDLRHCMFWGFAPAPGTVRT